eukprot:SAG11_NODE_35911_length_264_cov_0.933333_1_plen_48_part_10
MAVLLWNAVARDGVEGIPLVHPGVHVWEVWPRTIICDIPTQQGWVTLP